ncbi:MAG: hypothetical protein C4536_01850 [Actinobacteria bacterium]|jgi:hypothetical protein|nr:MAG: hypothetical protein C4536_01850 [Actinomycetota bacterium]
MDSFRDEAAPRPRVPQMNKRIVMESYKAACLLLDWVRAATLESMAREASMSNAGLAKWSFLEYMSRPEVTSYAQIEDRTRLLQILAGLELALLLSADKEESFTIRREWQKLGKWMRENHCLDPIACGLDFKALMGDEVDLSASKTLVFLIEHMPELKSGWNEGGADALNDYLYVLWLEVRGSKR